MKVFLAAATLGIGVATQPVPTSAFLALYAVYFSFGGPLTFLNEAISTETPSKLFIFAAVNSSTHKVYFASYEVLHF